MIEAAVNSFRIPDLRQKILFTAAILVVFRFIAHVPVPGVNVAALRSLFESNQLIGMLDLFSGGAMSSFSIAAMGVYPYITAQIIVQLMIPIIPRLQEMANEGESGRNKMNQWTHYLTVPMALLQAFGTINFVNATSAQPILPNFGFAQGSAWHLRAACSPCRGHDAAHLAGRADHPERRGQRHLHPDLRGHRGRAAAQPPGRASPAAPTRAA